MPADMLLLQHPAAAGHGATGLMACVLTLNAIVKKYRLSAYARIRIACSASQT
jgi:hypothetical protein